MAKTPTALTLLASQSVAANGSVNSAVIDLRAQDGGQIRLAITNGTTGPGAQCVGRVFVARNQGSAPAAAAEGVGNDDWKQVDEFGGGLVASAKTRRTYTFGPEVSFVYVSFSDHTSQPVTVEATGDAYAY